MVCRNNLIFRMCFQDVVFRDISIFKNNVQAVVGLLLLKETQNYLKKTERPMFTCRGGNPAVTKSQKMNARLSARLKG